MQVLGYFYEMKLSLSCLLLFLTGLILNGCTPSVSQGNKTVFYYNESGSVKSLDPAYSTDLESMWIINQLFDGLVELDSNLIPQPLIAHHWEISEDQKTYRFHLRQDVFFHSFQGKLRTVKASDFVFSFERIIDPMTASPGKWIFDACIKKHPFVAINDSLLEIRLGQPQGSFLQLLATVFGNVVMPEAVKTSSDNFRIHPIGCGPFLFKFWETDVAMVLHKNTHYWMKDEQNKSLPYLDAIKIDFVKDVYAEFQGLVSGKYDFMSGLDANFIDELLSDQGNLVHHQDLLNMFKIPFIKTDYIGFLLDKKSNSITQDIDFRKLIYYTTPRKEICQLRNHLIIPADQGFVPPTLLKKEVINSKNNLHQPMVDSLIQALHKRWGNPLPPVPLTITPEYTDIFEMMQKHWSKIGVNIELQVLQTASFKDAVSKGKVVMFRKNWLADYPDAENFLQIFRQSLWSPNGSNYTHYANPHFEKLFDESSKINDITLRKAKHEMMEEWVLGDFPVVPLYYDQVVHFVNKRIKNWQVNGINQIDLTKVKKEDLN